MDELRRRVYEARHHLYSLGMEPYEIWYVAYVAYRALRDELEDLERAVPRRNPNCVAFRPEASNGSV